MPEPVLIPNHWPISEPVVIGDLKSRVDDWTTWFNKSLQGDPAHEEVLRLNTKRAWAYLQRAAQEPGVPVQIPWNLFDLIWTLAWEDPRLKGHIRFNSNTHEFQLNLDRPLKVSCEGPSQTRYNLIGAEEDWL